MYILIIEILYPKEHPPLKAEHCAHLHKKKQLKPHPRIIKLSAGAYNQGEENNNIYLFFADHI